MKYLLVSYSKCGTKSYTQAFRQLGFDQSKICDFKENVIDHNDFWYEILQQKTSKKRTQELFYNMYKDKILAADVPCIHYWYEIYQVFPEVKFIFYQRDLEKWLKSMENQWESINNITCRPDWVSSILVFIFSPLRRKLRKLLHLTLEKTMAGSTYRPRRDWLGRKMPFSDLHVSQSYRKHCADFLYTVTTKNMDKDKVLILDEKTVYQWKPLCDFLGKEVPKDLTGEVLPFPHENRDGEYTKEFVEQVKPVIVREFLTRSALMIILVILIWYLLRKFGIF